MRLVLLEIGCGMCTFARAFFARAKLDTRDRWRRAQGAQATRFFLSALFATPGGAKNQMQKKCKNTTERNGEKTTHTHTHPAGAKAVSHVEHAAAHVLRHGQHLRGRARAAARPAYLTARLAALRKLDHEAPAEGGQVGVVAVVLFWWVVLCVCVWVGRDGGVSKI